MFCVRRKTKNIIKQIEWKGKIKTCFYLLSKKNWLQGNNIKFTCVDSTYLQKETREEKHKKFNQIQITVHTAFMMIEPTDADIWKEHLKLHSSFDSSSDICVQFRPGTKQCIQNLAIQIQSFAFQVPKKGPYK